MTYSEVVELTETKGMTAAMELIYDHYQASKKELQDAKRIFEQAESENNGWFSAADHLVRLANKQGKTILEDSSYLVRITRGDEVISFRIDPDRKIFIGNWPLSKL
jgi:hypothetical protein